LRKRSHKEKEEERGETERAEVGGGWGKLMRENNLLLPLLLMTLIMIERIGEMAMKIAVYAWYARTYDLLVNGLTDLLDFR